MIYYISIIIIVVSNVFYHLASKEVPGNTNPFFFVMVSYVVGFVLALTAFIVTAGQGDLISAVKEQSRLVNWTFLVLGISVIGLEIGNVLMYRAGWDISKGALFTNILFALILVSIGVVVFKEDFSTRHAAGLISCLIGMYLLT